MKTEIKAEKEVVGSLSFLGIYRKTYQQKTAYSRDV
jgi:hypothetical protein